MAVKTNVEIDRERVKELIAREEAELNARTQASKAMYERADKSLAAGVASSYQARAPWPIYLERGAGPRVWDVDGNEMYDFHNGFGSMVQGHANPEIGHAVRDRYAMGTHFAAPTEDAIAVAENLAERWGLPLWRFTNSGSESTMDAIRIARAHTGRDEVVKVFGSYHGHHDTVMVSIGVAYDEIGDHEDLASLPYGAGIPQATVDQVIAVPFNDAGAMERRIQRLEKEGRLPACVIMEAAMMNLGVVLPEPGYLEEVREITKKYGIVLIFDEVKTGICIAPGGATEYFGVKPDLVTLAKALGGGFPVGAIGGTEEVMACVTDGTVYQVGTYNGNPLCVAATRANLEKEGRLPACVIMEAAMMNLGVVLPEPGYLEEVREITKKYGIVLIFDEVKTGICIAPGGATEYFGVKPDLVTLAKALGGGFPVGAIGGTEEVMACVTDGTVYQVGTYNGNPLCVAATRANLEKVMVPAAYEHLNHLNDRILEGCTNVIEKYNLPGYAVGIGSKGCVTFSTEKVIDYETFKANQDEDMSTLAWLFNMNRGIFMTPGREEEWTLSITHTDEAVDRYVEVFDEMAREITES